ncbi:hypothetical protein BsWGS_02811 [Bradybaena similaris]
MLKLDVLGRKAQISQQCCKPQHNAPRPLNALFRVDDVTPTPFLGAAAKSSDVQKKRRKRISADGTGTQKAVTLVIISAANGEHEKPTVCVPDSCYFTFFF